MGFVQVSKDEGIVTLTLNRGKVNALNEPMVEELKECFENIEKDKTIKSVILTGNGKFFFFWVRYTSVYELFQRRLYNLLKEIKIHS